MALDVQEFNQQKGLSIIHMNVRSLVNKFSEVKMFLANNSNNSPDILVLSETWAHHDTPQSFFTVQYYNCWRFDRQFLNAKGELKQGGGLCIYVAEKYDITAEEIQSANISCEDLELFWLKLNIKQTKPIYIGAIYRPPSGNVT